MALSAVSEVPAAALTGPGTCTPVRVRRIEYAAVDTHLVELESLDGRDLPAVSAGAHVDIRLPAAAALATTSRVRQYSLVRPLCSGSRYVLGVRRDDTGRGGSRWIHDELRVGSTLEIGAPRNTFALDESAASYVLIAGGIGITPVISMLDRLTELGRPVRMHYFCRSPEHAVFADLLAGDHRVAVHYGRGDGTRLRTALVAADRDAAVYCCGPETMTGEVTALAGERGQPVHVERFANAAPAPADRGGFTVVLAGRGVEIGVAAGRSILEAVLDAGVDVPFSCEEGVCGACETTVVSGEPVHFDTVRAPAEHNERRTVMICCARSRSEKLVLDI
ncbi:PDR/VanB family oxidoreductase [Nocardia sp. NPDC024068]|uniref:PDR/VanB family oxidoreductase n=1 Tax=Nocardia sp. NPDC024068 TaxID=3157197 RepID=UPI0033D3DBC2